MEGINIKTEVEKRANAEVSQAIESLEHQRTLIKQVK